MPDGNDTGAQVGQILLQALTQAAQLRHDAQQFAQQMGQQAKRDKANIFADLFNRGLIDRGTFSQAMGIPTSAIPEEAPAVVSEKALTQQRGAETTRVALGAQSNVEKEKDLSPEQRNALQQALARNDTAAALRITSQAPEASKIGRLRAQLDRDSMERTGKPVDERVFQGAVAAEFGFEIDPQMAEEAQTFQKESRRLGLSKLRLEVDEARFSLDALKKGGDLTKFQRGQLLLELGDEKRTAARGERVKALQKNVDDRRELDGLLRKKEASEKASGKPLTRDQSDRLSELKARERSPLNPLPSASELAEEKSMLDDLFDYDEQVRTLVMGGAVEGGEEGAEGDEGLVDAALADQSLPAEEFDPDVAIGRILSGEQEPTDEVVSQLAAELQVDESVIRDKIERSRAPKRATGAQRGANAETITRARRKQQLGLPLTPEEEKLVTPAFRTRFPAAR